MDDIKKLDFKIFDDHIATATTHSLPKPTAININDQVTLVHLHSESPVIVNLIKMDGDAYIGKVHHFENYEDELLDGVREGDLVPFRKNNIDTWQPC